MADLITPDVRFHRSWLEADDEFGDAHVDGGGLEGRDRAAVRTEAGFADYVGFLRAASLPDSPRPEGHVACTFLWITEGEEFVGSLGIRHSLTPFLLEQGGHIGYSVRPGARRRGHASKALADALPLCRELGIDRVLVTCDEDNLGSRAVIETNGGVLEDVRGDKRRYWIDTQL